MKWGKKEIAALSIQTTGLVTIVFSICMEVIMGADIWWAMMTGGAWIYAIGVKLLKF